MTAVGKEVIGNIGTGETSENSENDKNDKNIKNGDKSENWKTNFA